MKKENFDVGWRFHLESDTDVKSEFGFRKNQEATGFAARGYDCSAWRTVRLPHDWGVELGYDLNADPSHGHRPISPFRRKETDESGRPTEEKSYPIGWYRKEFFVDAQEDGQRFVLIFDGVFRDCMVWINGAYLDRHLSGYTGFSLDITDHIAFGEKNNIAVRVDASQFEGWWYEGAGIYRHVWLCKCQPIHIPFGETAVRPEIDGRVTINTQVQNEAEFPAVGEVRCRIYGPDGCCCAETVTGFAAEPFSGVQISLVMQVESPQLWDIDAPFLYRAELTVLYNGAEQDQEQNSFGFREIRFDAEQGCFLNGRHIEMNGMCVHQDFAGVGVALPDRLHAYKIEKLKEMGVNAYRTSHHPPAPELLDACDRLGVLVMDEHRECSSSPEGLRQMEALVRRDRNHPCVVLWSIGNEEHQIQSNSFGTRAAKTMVRLIRRLDPTRAVTFGGNNGIDYEGINSVVDVRGLNYIHMDGTTFVKDYHSAHPQQPMLGSEEASAVMARGKYCTDMEKGFVCAYDENTMPWGSTAEGWWKFYHKTPYLCGAFAWTGFDYRGEPSPFSRQDSCSNFGIIDLCGFPKDVFYYYQSWWTSRPVLHLFPHWNHKVGENVRVVAYTNCDKVELVLNGGKVGETAVLEDGHAEFTVAFQPGTLTAIGYKNGQELLRDCRVTAGVPAGLSLSADRAAVSPDGDVSLVEVQLFDAEKNPVYHTEKEIFFRVHGGRIIGVGNGDPTSTEAEQFLDTVESTPLYGWSRRVGDRMVPVDVSETCTEARKERPDSTIVEVEQGHSYFKDNRRLVWNTPQVQEETKEYSVTFPADGQKSELYFPRIYGGYRVYLNGQLVAEGGKDEILKQAGMDWTSPLLEIETVVGINELRVECSSDSGRCGIYEGVYVQRTAAAQWKRSTFGGKCLALVESADKNITIEAFGEGLEPATLSVSLTSAQN